MNEIANTSIFHTVDVDAATATVTHTTIFGTEVGCDTLTLATGPDAIPAWLQVATWLTDMGLMLVLPSSTATGSWSADALEAR